MMKIDEEDLWVERDWVRRKGRPVRWWMDETGKLVERRDFDVE